MATTTGNLGMDDVVIATTRTNKGASIPKKCNRCDETVVNEDKCPRCFSLTEDAKPILTD
jgi:hypothetical protein